jgi:hypothetical protein
MIEQCVENINKCGNGLLLENDIASTMSKGMLDKKSPLFKLEDNFLNLASSGSTDSLFYCCVLSVQTEDHEEVFIARFFEHGTLEGFFRNVCHSRLKDNLKLTTPLLPYKVYTETDVDADNNRNKMLFCSKKVDGRKKLILLKYSFFFTKNLM